MAIVARTVDLIFIVRVSDNMVIDRRRAPLPTGFVQQMGTTVVNGYSEGVTKIDGVDATGLGVIPNGFIWNGDDPASFATAPEAPPASGDSTVQQLAEIKSAANQTLAKVADIEASLGIVSGA